MNDSQDYMLRWRGRQTGPYPVSEINRMLDEHKIGMGHEILYQQEWITLEAFFLTLQKAPAPAAKAPPPATSAMPLAPVPTVALPSRERGSPLHIKVSVTQAAETARRPSQAGTEAGRPRSRLLFAFLAVLAGFLGVHNFYARQWLTGLLQLLLSVATFLMGFGIVAAWLWAMVEAVVVRRDGHGIDMI